MWYTYIILLFREVFILTSHDACVVLDDGDLGRTQVCVNEDNGDYCRAGAATPLAAQPSSNPIHVTVSTVACGR